MAATTKYNEATKAKSRNSHFSLSQSNRPAKFQNETSAKSAWTPEKLQLRDKASLGDPHSMRVANFKMGFEPSIDYGTTSDHNNAFFQAKENVVSVGSARQ